MATKIPKRAILASKWSFRRDLLFLCCILSLCGCGNEKKKYHKKNIHGEHLYRIQGDHFLNLQAPTPRSRKKYPWEDIYCGNHLKITKEFFRCKGSSTHPVITRAVEGKDPNHFRDCIGGHGLPLKEDKEFIYPCLLELLNYIQEKTHKKVVLTSGHRCPIHNSYCDSSPSNSSSKHMLGAEVDFYVEGLEGQPNAIISLVQKYYKEHPDFKEKKDYEFQRYKKEGLNVSTQPWYNKEVFVKLYLKEEGRNFDNSHSYPYIGIQVRYDRDLEKQVTFDHKQAQHYLRH